MTIFEGDTRIKNSSRSTNQNSEIKFDAFQVGSGVHSLAETRVWEGSHLEQERNLVADHYTHCLGDLLNRMEGL